MPYNKMVCNIGNKQLVMNSYRGLLCNHENKQTTAATNNKMKLTDVMLSESN